MHPMLNIAITAARNASRILVRFMDRLDEVEVSTKSRGDYVTQADKLSEQEIINTIRKAYPDHSILAEESGETAGNDRFLWIIDPLDGTTNFIHGYPMFSISIAVQIDKKLTVGVVYDPVAQELFSTERGKGAFLNNRRIRVSGCKKLEDGLLSTGFPTNQQTVLAPLFKRFERLVTNSTGIRRGGSAALDLAYVAAGRLDGYWEQDLKSWDIAAGALLVTEAGGMLSDFQGRMDFLKSGNIVAATPRLHQPMLNLLHESPQEE